MGRSDLLILLVVGAVLFIVYRKTDVQLAQAKADAARTAAGNAMVGQAVAVAGAIYGV